MNNIDTIRKKIRTAGDAAEALKELRKKAGKVVFTNGCFDLLHAGHVDYLSKAADMGDCLVIGLNTDASVSRNKGHHRPINSLESRSLVLASLGFVSMVVPFDEDTPIELIKLLRPDVLVKGGDYTISNIVGADVVKEYGGTVATIAFVPGYSTSAIEKKIIESQG